MNRAWQRFCVRAEKKRSRYCLEGSESEDVRNSGPVARKS